MIAGYSDRGIDTEQHGQKETRKQAADEDLTNGYFQDDGNQHADNAGRNQGSQNTSGRDCTKGQRTICACAQQLRDYHAG